MMHQYYVFLNHAHRLVANKLQNASISSRSRLFRNNINNLNTLVCSSFGQKYLSTLGAQPLIKTDSIQYFDKAGKVLNCWNHRNDFFVRTVIMNKNIIDSNAFFSTASIDRSLGWTLEREESLNKILTGKFTKAITNISKDKLEKEMKVIIAALASQNRHNEIPHWIDKMNQYSMNQKFDSDSAEASAHPQIVALVPFEIAISSLVDASKKCDSEEESAHFLLQAETIMEEYLKSYHSELNASQNGPITGKMLDKMYGDLILGWSNCKYEKTSYQSRSQTSNIHGDEKDSLARMSKFGKIVPAQNAEKWLRLAVTHTKSQKGSFDSNEISANTFKNSVHQMRGPTSIMFGAVIDAYAKSRTSYAAQSAESVLSFLIDLREEDKMWPKPNAVMYTSVIDAWSRSPRIDFAAKSVVMWLDRMEKEYDNGNTHAKPSIIAYSAAIMTFSRRFSRDERHFDKKSTQSNYAILAEKCLFRLIRRNRKLKALASKTANNDVELMTLLNEYIVHPDINVFNGVINCWAQQVGDGQDQKKNLQNAFYAESWLMLLLNCTETQPTLDLTENEFDPRSYEEHYLDPETEKKMMVPSIIAAGIAPDIVSFNSVINAYARIKKSRAAALKVDQLFQMMKDYALEPTSITYGSAIKSWGNTNSCEGAEKATMYLHEYETAGRNGLIQPNVIAYNAALNAWAGSSRTDALDKMHSMIKRMETISKDKSSEEGEDAALVPPDIVSYNTLLKACMNHQNKSRAFQLTLHIFHNKIATDQNNLSKALDPDLTTFATIFACIRNCVPEKNHSDESYLKLCQKVFDCCCQLGMVDKYVLSSLQSALPGRNDFYSMVYGESTGNDREIPISWKRNARKRRLLKMNFGRSQHGAATKSAAIRSRQMKLSSRTRMKR